MGFFSRLLGQDKGRPNERTVWGDASSQYQSGVGLTSEGLAGLRGLDTQYQDLIAGGGLTPDLKRQFGVARGYLNDQYTRASRSLGAALASRRQQMGGALTPGAVAEMEQQGAATRDEQFFDASNNLAGQQAQLGYQSTMDLYKNIQNIRSTITQSGLTSTQQAQLARLQAASMNNQNRQFKLKLVSDLLGSVVKGFGGGGK